MKNSINITSFLKLAIVVGLILWASMLMRPFLGALAWGVILAVAIYPFYKKIIGNADKKKKKRITTVFTVITVLLLIVPTYSIFSSFLETSTQTLRDINNGELKVPAPTDKVKTWPLGEKI